VPGLALSPGSALEALLQRLAPYHLCWWLIGSAALVVRGIDVLPGDLDLVVDDTGALLLEEVLFDSLVGPVEDARGWIGTWFGRAFLQSRIEWAGGIREDVDEQGVTEFGPVAAGRLESISWYGYQMRVPPLAIQVEVSKRKGLEERARKIEQALHP
jgi:hypothetical protein